MDLAHETDAAVAATAVEFDSTVTRAGTSQLNSTVFGHMCWTCFQSCVYQSEL